MTPTILLATLWGSLGHDQLSGASQGVPNRPFWKPIVRSTPMATTNQSACSNNTGENDAMKFGLLSGSYKRNTAGGVLRKNVGSITDEIIANTGQFSTTEGIIKTFDRFRIVNFDYSNHSYDCGWITTRPINDGEYAMWGHTHR